MDLLDKLKDKTRRTSHGIKEEIKGFTGDIKSSLGLSGKEVRSMEGTWSSPLPIVLVDAGDGAFRGVGADILLTVEKQIAETVEAIVTDGVENKLVLRETVRHVKMTSNGGAATFHGNVNYELTRIQWATGAVWTKELTGHLQSGQTPHAVAASDDCDLRPALKAVQTGLLSTRQASVVIDKINDSVDLPILPEHLERKLIKRIVDKINMLMTEALQSCVSPWMLEGIVALLDETSSARVKSERIRLLLKGRMKVPVVSFLNDHIDMPGVPLEIRELMLKKVVGELIKHIVQQSVLALERASFG